MKQYHRVHAARDSRQNTLPIAKKPLRANAGFDMDRQIVHLEILQQPRDKVSQIVKRRKK
jgi:hypothetical protein